MEPTYHDSTLNLVNRIVLPLRAPRRGDVVAIRLAGPTCSTSSASSPCPTERVAIVDGHRRNQRRAARSSRTWTKRAAWDYPEVTVGPREYFVIGDNRGMRMGDHDFGRVDAAAAFSACCSSE